ncbi:hypothetical protein [Haloferula helveola]
MKSFFPPLISGLLGVIAAVGPVAESAVVYEGFDYPAGSLSGANGGTGFSGPGGSAWVESDSGSNPLGVRSPGLSFGSLPVSGNTAERTSNLNRAQANRTISDSARSTLTADGTTIWFSVLWLPGASGSDERGAFMFGNSSFGDTSGDPVTSGDGFGFSPYTGVRNTTIHANAWVVGDASTNPAASDDSGLAHTSATYLLVGKINWNASGTADEFFLFNVTDPAAPEPGEGSAIASITDQDFDQSDWNTISIYENHAGEWDEIRFATTYAEALGVPEPSRFHLIAVGGALLCLHSRRR